MKRKFVPGLTIVAMSMPAGVALAQDAGLEEIVVTATRREESLQNLANSATVFSSSDLQALRVFEPRYVDMVARCLRGANRFGVVAIREGAEVGAATTYDYGTSAEIVDWHQEPGGLLGILAAGREPFHVRATRREPDGLYVGTVAWLESVPAKRLTSAHEPLAALLKRLIESSLTVTRSTTIAAPFRSAAFASPSLTTCEPTSSRVKPWPSSWAFSSFADILPQRSSGAATRIFRAGSADATLSATVS